MMMPAAFPLAAGNYASFFPTCMGALELVVPAALDLGNIEDGDDCWSKVLVCVSIQVG